MDVVPQAGHITLPSAGYRFQGKQAPGILVCGNKIEKNKKGNGASIEGCGRKDKVIRLKSLGKITLSQNFSDQKVLACLADQVLSKLSFLVLFLSMPVSVALLAV